MPERKAGKYRNPKSSKSSATFARWWWQTALPMRSVYFTKILQITRRWFARLSAAETPSGIRNYGFIFRIL